MSKGDKEIELVGNYLINFFKSIGRFFKCLSLGFIELPKKKSRWITLLVVTFVSILVLLFRKFFIGLIPEKYKQLRYLIYLVPLLPVIHIFWLGEEREKYFKSFEQKFETIGFYSKGKTKKLQLDGSTKDAIDYPRFLSEKKDGKKVILSFFTNIPLKEWKAKYLEIETVFNCNIIRIENAKTSKQVIKVHTIPANQGLKDFIPWSDDYIKEKDFEITVGIAMLEDVIFDFNKTPHLLIGGETGSGKSVIQRCINWQCIKKGAKVYMADFKGGVEFSKVYESFGEVVTERERLIEILQELIEENTARLKLFRDLDVKNLGEYNALPSEMKPKGYEELCRIVLIVDEVAEMLDKTGLNKEEKQVYYQIEGYLSTPARLARATGINMIFGTQRPDSKILTGQIKNNLPVRICGKMSDMAASEIVLGNTKAFDLGDTKGRFIFKIADSIEFQAYMFNDNQLKVGDYVKGGMLTVDVPEAKETKKTSVQDKLLDDYLEDEEENTDEITEIQNNNKSDKSEEIEQKLVFNEDDEDFDLSNLSSEEWQTYCKQALEAAKVKK
jgi:energy-coupling factor transporter ATP-binding protein EcfA2